MSRATIRSTSGPRSRPSAPRLRTNLFGFAIGRLDYAIPQDRRGGQGALDLQPGAGLLERQGAAGRGSGGPEPPPAPRPRRPAIFPAVNLHEPADRGAGPGRAAACGGEPDLALRQSARRRDEAPPAPPSCGFPATAGWPGSTGVPALDSASWKTAGQAAAARAPGRRRPGAGPRVLPGPQEQRGRHSTSRPAGSAPPRECAQRRPWARTERLRGGHRRARSPSWSGARRCGSAPSFRASRRSCTRTMDGRAARPARRQPARPRVPRLGPGPHDVRIARRAQCTQPSGAIWSPSRRDTRGGASTHRSGKHERRVIPVVGRRPGGAVLPLGPPALRGARDGGAAGDLDRFDGTQLRRDRAARPRARAPRRSVRPVAAGPPGERRLGLGDRRRDRQVRRARRRRAGSDDLPAVVAAATPC